MKPGFDQLPKGNNNFFFSPFHHFLDHIVGIDFLLRFWFELFDKLIGHIFRPFIPHSHQILFEIVAFHAAFLLSVHHNRKCLV